MIASMLRRTLQASVLLTLVTALGACGTASPQGGEKAQGAAPAAQDAKGKETSAKAKDVRIGFQKYGTMNFLKAEGKLDKKLKDAGYTVTWTEFPGGPQLLEALNVGSLDLGHTGESPPIFAQAAGAPLVYLAHEPASPKSEAILVPQNSPLKSVAELKGKKVALNKGSNVHYLLVKQLEKAGLKYGDIQPVFLPPADARVAFERGSVDAWVIWDPFLAAAQTATKAKVLADGTDTVSNHEFYIASRSFAENQSEVTSILLEELNKVDEWAKTNQGELAKLLSPQLGIDIPSLEQASKRREYGVLPIDDKVIAEQQKIADTFLDVGLIPKPIQIKEAVLSK
ncbi:MULTISPECIES: sulfonate ABC transporter substrate-binding protein [Paenibacillus]|uniref:sulfonate ABC transporter substrate-binding protein n=1 Tax=Paenibacillus TaxID=44249 RepID=UPI0022B8E529|nr:sulfonate ABC transporter substrate-binding protein [Paenibacillus caseinilyticus]MCZ8522742.1 sulfonate ABC transporter substrate-binding protein [Paenibacillus caseinilyticus]